MLLVLVSKPLDACGQVFDVCRAYGCVEVCYGGRDVESECCGVHICVKVTLRCVQVDVSYVYWFFNEAYVFWFGFVGNVCDLFFCRWSCVV